MAATERNAQGVLSDSVRKAFLAALDEPMTDDEAVGLIAELVQLTCAVAKVATTEQQKELTPKLLRAGNMVPYIADRLAAVAELVKWANEADDMLDGCGLDTSDTPRAELRAALLPFQTEAQS